MLYEKEDEKPKNWFYFSENNTKSGSYNMYAQKKPSSAVLLLLPEVIDIWIDKLGQSPYVIITHLVDVVAFDNWVETGIEVIQQCNNLQWGAGSWQSREVHHITKVDCRTFKTLSLHLPALFKHFSHMSKSKFLMLYVCIWYENVTTYLVNNTIR